jgi:transcriptional regulator with XRE-family HTH domain
MCDIMEVQRLLGVRVRSRRAQLGLTQHALAARSGFSRPSIANVEAGRQNVTLRQLCAVAGALEVDVSELVRAGAAGSEGAGA